MAYASAQDLFDRWPALAQVADRDGDGQPDAAIVAAALDDASAEVDARLAPRFAVPLAPVPAVLVGIAGRLARYALYSGNDVAPPDEVQADRKAALDLLAALADGRADLVPAATTATAVGPRWSAPPRLFTPQTLQDF